MTTSAGQCDIQHADRLYHHGAADTVYEYLNPFVDHEEDHEYVDGDNDSDNPSGPHPDPEILWRYARACADFYKCIATDKYHKKELIRKGLRAVEVAVEIDTNNSHCVNWLGCLIGYDLEVNPLQSGCIKKCVSGCRDNIKRATELDPTNAEAWYSYGAWHYNILDRPFYERTIFSYMSGIKVTVEDGLPHLLKANEVSKNPFLVNWLYLGKCYLYLKKLEEAKLWLQKVMDYHQSGRGTSSMDEYAIKEAEKLLKEKF